jgi:hypothetical protein
LVPLKIVSNVSRFKPALNLNRVLAELSRGSNSLNSASVVNWSLPEIIVPVPSCQNIFVVNVIYSLD